jgi:hypothetical protein
MTQPITPATALERSDGIPSSTSMVAFSARRRWALDQSLHQIGIFTIASTTASCDRSTGARLEYDHDVRDRATTSTTSVEALHLGTTVVHLSFNPCESRCHSNGWQN